MAIYNGFPATYQPMYYPQYQPVQQAAPQPVQQPQQNTSGINWVQGEAGMKAYFVAPNTTVPLWDSENQVIYLKSADASGMPSVKTLDYTVREQKAQQQKPAGAASPVAYATKEDVEALNEQIASLRQDIDGLTIRRAPARKKEADDE